MSILTYRRGVEVLDFVVGRVFTSRLAKIMVSDIGFVLLTVDFTPSLDPVMIEVYAPKDDEALCRIKVNDSRSAKFSDAYTSMELYKLKPWQEDRSIFLRLRSLLLPADPLYLQRWLAEHPKPPEPQPVEMTEVLEAQGLFSRLFGPPRLTIAEAYQRRKQQHDALSKWQVDYWTAERTALEIREGHAQPITFDLQRALEKTRAVESLWVKLDGAVVAMMHNRKRGQHYALYRSHLWASSSTLTDDDWKLLADRHDRKQRTKLESIRNAATGDTYARSSIPEDVRMEVWRRDQGKCARCGSRDNLEFDHIVPVSLGGSNTARNIELLCQNCNRSKSASIA